ncbi:uncharacterized protein DNG_02444 [Cephalotrichum gorgonifer]|uniref:N-acetyltransferase domain-containing protein n=1 Tax=Cephalotrichum gorgonifer TaxID=2041049 RepID=A0AAE8SSK5_9PEZI|nr:uncharacterized protein DNG_02444 [Cephalotrichum gorgonifer]
MEHQSSSLTLVEIPRSLVPPTWDAAVRRASMSECREVALSLAHSFATDGFSMYLVGAWDMAHLSHEEKWRLHVDMMAYSTAAHFLSGIVKTIGPEYDSVAVWLPPGADADGWWTVLRSGLWRIHFMLSTEGRRRYFDEVLPLLHRTKVEVMGARDAECYYLVYLGTKPNSRGRGYAGKLIEDLIRVRVISLTRGLEPVQLDIMVREPRAGFGGYSMKA